MRLSAAEIAFTLVSASLALMSAARADEPVAGAAFPVAVLHLVNGDLLPGVPLDCDQEGVLEWQGSAFTKPFRFDGDVIAEIRFAAHAVGIADAGEFRFDLSGGDALLGDLLAVGDDELVVNSSQVGRVRLKRSESLRLSRCRGNPALVYQGPNGLPGWGPPEAATAWTDDGGQLTTDRDSAVLECDVTLPSQALIELAISWKSQPEFALVLGSDGGDDGARQAFRFEVLDRELIVRRETRHDFDIESVMPLGVDGPGRIHLLALLDQERERLQVLSTDGKPLAAIHAAAEAPRVRPGIRLEHQHGGLRLELLRVSRYSGRPPHEVTEDAPRVHLTDGTVVYGSIKRYDAGKRRFVLQTEGADEMIDVDRVENVFLARPTSESAESEQARQSPADRKPTARPADQVVLTPVRVTCVDGTRLSGRFAGFHDGQLQMACPAAFDSVAWQLAGLREVRFTNPTDPIRNRFEVAFPVLQADGLKLHGKLAPARSQAGASCLAWQPLGSSTSSPLRASTSGRIAFATPFLVDNFARPNPKLWQMGQGQWDYSGGRLLQRHTGNMLCSLRTLADHPRDFSAAFRFKITGGKANKNVALQFDDTEDGDAHFVYLAPELSALQIGHRQQGKETGAGAGGGVKIDVNLNQEYLLEIEVRDRLFNVSLDGQPMLSYHLPYERRAGRLRLSSYEATAEFISIAVRPLPFASDVADVVPREGATASNPPQLDDGKAPQGASDPRKPSVRLDRIERRVQPVGEELPDRLFLRTGDTLPCRVTAIDERGVSLKSPFSEASVVPHVWVRAIEVGPQTSPPQLDADKLARLLTLPRAQKLDPPTHVIGATNGDYLRGKLTAMDERVLRFEVQGRERELFRDRIARVVWLGLDEDAADETPPGCVQAIQLDGARMTFTAEEVDDVWISGEADLLGPCRVRFDQLRELLFGNRVRRAAAKLIYSWKLVDAQTPLAFRTDPANGGETAEGAESPLVGQPASDFELPMLDGATFRLSQRRGTTVVLDFWASWCGPCMQGLPKVAGVVAACDPEKVLLVAVNLQETSVEATDALRRLKLEIAVVLDREGKVAKEYGAASIPYTVVIGPDGTIARVFVGTGPQLERQLAEALSKLRAAAP